MKPHFTATGMEELKRKIAGLPTAVSRKVQLQALRAGAEPIRSMASTLAPRGDDAPHMADNIVIVTPTARASEANGLFDTAVVWIGPLARFFYGYFQEFGTAFHPAQPFMRPAFDTQGRVSLRIIAAEAWAALKRYVATGVRSTSGRGE